MSFNDFCLKKHYFDDCSECIYEHISDKKECEKQFDLDNSNFITELDFKIFVKDLVEGLNDLNQKIDFVYDQI